VDAAGAPDRPLTLRWLIALLVAAGSVAHAATDRTLALAQQLARARLVVAGAVTQVSSHDDGRLTVARVRPDRVLKGAAAGDVNVVEHHDLPSVPDLLRDGDHVVLFLAPAASSSALARALPAGKYFEPVGGRHGVIAGSAAEADEAAAIVARMVAASAAPEPDRDRRAAQHRVLVFDELAGRHPRLVADGAAALPGVPDLTATLTDAERRRLEAALARTDLPSWVRVQLVESIGAANLTALAPALHSLPGPDAPTLEASWTALRRLGSPPTAADVATALGSGDPAVRAAAARALLATGEPDAVSRVTRLALEDPSADVRTAATEALGATQRPDVLSSIEEVFRRSDWPTRQAAGRAINRVGGRPAQESLARLAFDPNADVQRYAVTLLLVTGISRDDPLIQRIRASHPDPAIRRLVTEGAPKLLH